MQRFSLSQSLFTARFMAYIINTVDMTGSRLKQQHRDGNAKARATSYILHPYGSLGLLLLPTVNCYGCAPYDRVT